MPQGQSFDLITQRQIIGTYFLTYDATMSNSWVGQLATTRTSNQASETYAGLGTIPAMREWVGGKNFAKAGEKSLTVTNKDWESSIHISNKDRRRDKTGQVMEQVQALAIRAGTWAESRISAMIAAGAASTYGNAWTGSTFFNDSHSIGNSQTWDNSISIDISALPTGDTTGTHGSTTAPSIGEMALSIQQAIQTMYGFVDDQGEPTNQTGKAFMVMVPTTLWAAAAGAISSQVIAQGFDNPLTRFGMQLSVVPNPRLNASWTDKFAVFRTDGIVKPFLIQYEVPTTLKMLAEGSDYEFTNGGIAASVEMAGNTAYYGPDKACLVTMT